MFGIEHYPLFFLSFLPQFVSPRAESAFPALLVLGLTFLTTGTLWCLVLALGIRLAFSHPR